jgi:diaminohydroxyphosphoribosylaminopyrimidine deaminase/5-amino-6-(5-phosphoribosylamino)uracil reductase
LIEYDDIYMRKALAQARKGLGRTSPNPAVGAVIVRDGEVVAAGYHRKAGGDHAEVAALKKIEGRARKGDVLYVTLEPCNHSGRTPPCTEAILKAGIGTVVIGMSDPNPNVRGGGGRYLAGQGITVRTGVLAAECERLNEFFIKHVSTGKPFVVAKSAMTLDGWTATATGRSQWITNERSRRFVHGIRNRVDAVMVGIGTVLQDDPSLRVRLKGTKGRDPIRIVADTRLRIPTKARIISQASVAETWIVTGDPVPAERRGAIERPGVKIMACRTMNRRIHLGTLMERLGGLGVASILLEGGSAVMGSMIRERLIDKFYLFKAPKLMGGGDGYPMASGPGAKTMEQCLHLENIRTRRFGDDLMIRGYPVCSPD